MKRAEYNGLERRNIALERKTRRWVWALTCLLLATLSLGTLVFSYQSVEKATAAETRAKASETEAKNALRTAEMRGAINRLLTCKQVRDIHELMRLVALKPKKEPLCDDLDLEPYRAMVAKKK